MPTCDHVRPGAFLSDGAAGGPGITSAPLFQNQNLAKLHEKVQPYQKVHLHRPLVTPLRVLQGFSSSQTTGSHRTQETDAVGLQFGFFVPKRIRLRTSRMAHI